MVVSEDTSSGRVMVLAKELSKPLVKIGGVWLVGVFGPDELKDNFERVIDSKRAEMLFQEASAALSDNPNLPKAAIHAS